MVGDQVYDPVQTIARELGRSDWAVYRWNSRRLPWHDDLKEVEPVHRQIYDPQTPRHPVRWCTYWPRWAWQEVREREGQSPEKGSYQWIGWQRACKILRVSRPKLDRLVEQEFDFLREKHIRTREVLRSRKGRVCKPKEYSPAEAGLRRGQRPWMTLPRSQVTAIRSCRPVFGMLANP
jgi:hypothetical protein